MAIDKLSLAGASRARTPETKYQTSITLPDEQAMLFEGLCASKNMQRPAMFSYLITQALAALPAADRDAAMKTYEGE